MRLFIAALFVASICALHARAEEPKTIKPVMVLTGTDSKVGDVSFARCRTDDEWRSTWKKHAGATRCPEVDFDKYEMLAIFQGQSSEGWGLFVPGVQEENNRLLVRYGSITQQVGEPQDFLVPGAELPTDSRPARKECSDYALVLVPRSNKAVVIEEGVLTDLTQPRTWHERARLAATPSTESKKGNASPSSSTDGPLLRRLIRSSKPAKTPPTQDVSIDGTWREVSSECGGLKLTEPNRATTLTVNGERLTWVTANAWTSTASWTVDRTTRPWAIDIVTNVKSFGEGGKVVAERQEKLLGICKVEGDIFTLCFNIYEGDERPKRFASSGRGTTCMLNVYGRETP